MEHIRAGLMAELMGRRGMMCRVLRGGLVARGDEIRRAVE
jgi:MOSC domain-containing protein YiiM